MFYAAGNYEARKGVDQGFITLHPSGLPHGPQPGAVEKALGKAVDGRARRHVGHLQAAPPVHALGRGGQAGVRLQLESGEDDGLAVHPAELTAGHVQHLAVHVVRPGGAEEEDRTSRLLG